MINLSSNNPKRSSSRRKGDQYQDIMALRLALELYIENQDFNLYMEYDSKGNLDDVVIFIDNQILAYQIKYSVDPHASYKIIDFIDEEDPNKKRVFIKKFAEGWKSFKENHPEKEIYTFLLTNHSVDEEINEIINNDGTFTEQFIENKKRKKARENRNKLKESSELNEAEFKEFLKSFQFHFKEKNIPELNQYIQENLLNTRLGIYDNSVYNILKIEFENYAIYSRNSINSNFFREIFEKETTKYLLHQVFEINEEFYVQRELFNKKLEKAIQNINGDYIIITGLPGSGKSTSLTQYLDILRDLAEYEVIKYYCFVDINDNFQNLRIQAKTLRINLLNQIQVNYSEILDRRYDYSEHNFNHILLEIGNHFEENEKKLVIFLDGLDHAEKMAVEVQESLLNTLPRSIPKGIIFIVGTQELHKWPIFLQIIKDNPEQSIVLPLFDFNETLTYLKKKLGENILFEEQVHKIFKISEGLPIYLRYISELMKDYQDFEEVASNLTSIENGEIKSYYDYLWDEFQQFGKGNVRHLCGVLACLRFQVKKDELINFQKILALPVFQDCFKLIKHLVKDNNDFVSIFHNSFREYVISQFDNQYLKAINLDITNHLKTLEYSDEWFSYVFEYAYQVDDYDYILEKVTSDLIDTALYNYRSEEDIENAITWAIKSAKDKKDLISLSRLASLKNITQQRVEYHMNWNLLSKVLLTLGDHEKVLKYTYSINHNKWLINKGLALSIIIQLAKQGFDDLSYELFQIFNETISFRKFENVEVFLKYCKCLGIHSYSVNNELLYLRACKINPSFIEEKLMENPENSFPHIEAYINYLIKFHDKPYWNTIKNIDMDSLNEIIQIYIIKSLAKNEKLELLKEELQEYASNYKDKLNSQIIFYKALTKFPISEIENEFIIPDVNDLLISRQVKYSDRGLEKYRRKLWTLGYINKRKHHKNLQLYLESNPSWWHNYLLYLIKAGEFYGYYLRNSDDDVFNLAIEALDYLSNIKPARREDIWNLIRVSRNELKTSLYKLTQVIVEKYPLRLTDWFNKIKSLQSSELWTKRVSFGELWDNYVFELLIYKKLSRISLIKRNIIDFLDYSEEKILQSTMIKGGNRVEHFFLLALISAYCGFKDKTKEWLKIGIKSTLIYGYRKDMTLYQLIRIMSKLNKYDSEQSLSRCAELIELVDWMPHLTDGKETRHFPYYIFREITKIDFNIALEVLKIYAKNKSRWQMQDCLEYLINKLNYGNPEILWALTELFTNEYSEDGRYSKQIFNSKQKIIELIEKGGDSGIVENFKDRLLLFVKTTINPKDWQKLDFKYFNIEYQEEKDLVSTTQEEDNIREYILNGEKVSEEEIKNKLQESFENYKKIINALKIENENFYITSEFSNILKNFILRTVEVEKLRDITDFINNNVGISLQEELAEKFYELGEISYALDHYEKAYLDHFGFFDWNPSDNLFLEIIKNHDVDRAKSLVIKKIYNILKKYTGFQVPVLIVNALDIFEDIESIQKIYEDYYIHTKSLFYHLPSIDDYEWIKTIKIEEMDFDQIALDLLTDGLKTIEIDLYRRLLDSYRWLCLKQPQLLIPYIFSKLSTSTGLLKERLIQIIYMISFELAVQLHPFIEQLEQELMIASFSIKMMLIKILKNIQKKIENDEEILEKIENLKYKTTTNEEIVEINIPNISPSIQFTSFLYRNINLIKKIEACCNVLNINENHFIHLLEENLLRQNWNIQEEEKRLNLDWKGNVHAQGFTYVPILTHFDYKILKNINKIINNLLEKNPVSDKQLKSLWRILQSVDFEYSFSKIKPRPIDIEKPVIENKVSWFDQLKKLDGTIKMISNPDEWITIFEFRCYETEEGLSERYKTHLQQDSILIRKDSSSAKEIEISMDLINQNENITIRQARNYIQKDIFKIKEDHHSLPILIKKANKYPFFGYRGIISLPKYIIDHYNLNFDNSFNFFRNGSIVAKFEEWQEGYVSNSYSRNLRFYGLRFLINHKLLKQILRDYNVYLSKRFLEARLFFKSIFDRNETEKEIGVYFERII